MLRLAHRLSNVMVAEQQKRHIVIVGGGIIGSTSAYFLSRHPNFDETTHTITLLEATKIAGGASGKAGGLLALWAYPSCIVPLSYRLHRELAEKHAGAERWGYRAVHCGQVEIQGVLSRSKDMSEAKGDSVSLQKRSSKATDMLKTAGVPQDLDWIAAEGVKSYDEMGDPTNTAQVHPYQFTTSMAQLAEEKGIKIIYGSATSINQENGKVTSVTYETKEAGEKTLEADTVLLTAGPWTNTIWKPAPISALRAHSVTIRPSRPVSAYALFTSINLSRNPIVTPEIYARPNNEVYACGSGDHLIPLPKTTDLVQIDDSRCQDIVNQVSSISEELRDGEVTARQACYLPTVDVRGGPLIGETSVNGLYLAAGHSCWGIQNAPATAQCLSELILEGKVRSAHIESLDPKKFGV